MSGSYYILKCHGGFWYVPSTRPDVDPAEIELTLDAYRDFLQGRHLGMLVLGWADTHATTFKGETLGNEVMLNDNDRWFSATK